jgi:hypothetical protein
MVDLVHLGVKGQRYIVAQQLKVRIRQQLRDIRTLAGVELVGRERLMSVCEEPPAQGASR